MGIKEKIEGTSIKNIDDMSKKIEKIMEKYEFVTTIKENDSRKLIGTYDDIDLYYNIQEKIFEFKIDGKYFQPEYSQLMEMGREYLVLT